ncbi:MAG: hypothetical protein L0H25_08545 [Micrococcales bacterium]|nr:hypothetical protein [Micrococcales bacterium]
MGHNVTAPSDSQVVLPQPDPRTLSALPGADYHEDMDSAVPYILALLPTVGLLALFYVVMKSILEGDRRERIAQAKWEAEQDKRAKESHNS